MSLDINKSFRFLFQDPQWPQKLVVGGVFILLLNIIHSLDWFLKSLINTANSAYEPGSVFVLNAVLSIIVFIFGVVLYAIPAGYALQSAHNEINDKEPLLPSWDTNFFMYFKYGIYYQIINFLYLFVIAVIAAIPFLLGFSIYNLYRDVSPLSGLGLIFSITFLIPIVLFFLILSPFIITTYAENFNFQEAFNLKRIISSISRIIPEYLAVIGLAIAVSILIGLLSVLLVCTCIGIVLIPFLQLPALLISFNLFSQAFKESRPSV